VVGVWLLMGTMMSLSRRICKKKTTSMFTGLDEGPALGERNIFATLKLMNCLIACPHTFGSFNWSSWLPSSVFQAEDVCNFEEDGERIW